MSDLYDSDTTDYEDMGTDYDEMDTDVEFDVDVGDVRDDLGFDLGGELDSTEGERARPFGAKLALLLTGLLSVVLGVAGGLGFPVATVGAISVESGLFAVPGAALGGVVVARAVRAIDDEENVSRAKGSVGVMVGTLLLVGSSLAAGPGTGVLVAAAIGVATATVGVGALVGVETDPRNQVRRTLRRSAVTLGVAAAVSVVLYTGVVYRTAVEFVTFSAAVALNTALGALVVLQVLAVLVVGLMEFAIPVLDDWTSTGEEEGGLLQTWRENGVSLTEIHVAYWAALAVQALLALMEPIQGTVDWVLSSMDIFGTAVRFALTSGALHLPLVFVGALAGLVLVARALQWIVVSWAGNEPPRALAYAAGGALLSVVVVPLGMIPLAVPWIQDYFPQTDAVATAFAIGPGTVVAVGTALLLAGAYVALSLAPVVTRLSPIPSVAGKFSLGAAAVLVAGLGTVSAGGHHLLAFVATATALLVWDLGENATGLVDQVGPTVDLRENEVTHAAGSLLVGVGGVALAGAAYYLLGWIPIPTPQSSSHAFLAMVLALVALVAFANLVTGDGSET